MNSIGHGRKGLILAALLLAGCATQELKSCCAVDVFGRDRPSARAPSSARFRSSTWTTGSPRTPS